MPFDWQTETQSFALASACFCFVSIDKFFKIVCPVKNDGLLFDKNPILSSQENRNFVLPGEVKFILDGVTGTPMS